MNCLFFLLFIISLILFRLVLSIYIYICHGIYYEIKEKSWLLYKVFLFPLALPYIIFGEPFWELTRFIFPHNHMAYKNLGDFYYARKKKEKALNCYMKAYSIDRSDNILTTLYKYHLKEKNYDLVIKYFKEIPPDCVYSSDGFEELTKRYEGLNDYLRLTKCQKELEHIEECIKDPEKNSIYFKNMDDLLFQRERLQKIIEELKQKGTQ